MHSQCKGRVTNLKQSLARALYSRKRFVILDDILSGLDAETEEQLFSAVLGPKGLLRKLGTTVVFATNAGEIYTKYSLLNIYLRY